MWILQIIIGIIIGFVSIVLYNHHKFFLQKIPFTFSFLTAVTVVYFYPEDGMKMIQFIVGFVSGIFGYQIFKDNEEMILEKAKKFESLKTSIKQTTPSKSSLQCYFEAASMVIRNMINEHIQKRLQISIKTLQTGEKIEVVRYFVNRTMYEIPVKIATGPKTIRVFTKQYNDLLLMTEITQEFLPLLGPNSDLHRLRVTPKDLGYPCLIFENQTLNGSSVVSLSFEEDEEVDLSTLKSIINVPISKDSIPMSCEI